MVAILHNDVGNMYVYISVYIGIGGRNWLSQQGPTCRVERDSSQELYKRRQSMCKPRTDNAGAEHDLSDNILFPVLQKRFARKKKPKNENISVNIY